MSIRTEQSLILFIYWQFAESTRLKFIGTGGENKSIDI